MTDIEQALSAKADQLNAIDLIGGPRTILVTSVSVDAAKDQPVVIYFEGDDGKPFKPSKGMGRVCMAVWGTTKENWVGQSLTLFREPTVTWGGQAVGGIQISHMTGLSEPRKVAHRMSRSKSGIIVIRPLEVAKNKEPEPNDTDFDVIVGVAKMAAKKGMAAYLEFWTAQDRAAQSYLVGSGDHEECKTAANLHDNPPKSEDDGS